MKTISISKWVAAAKLTQKLFMKPNFLSKTVQWVFTVALLAATNAFAFSGTVTIGTLPPGKSVRVIWQATINNPLPAGVGSVTNQGSVSGSNFATVNTTDLETAGAKTVTQVSVPPVVSTFTKTIAEDTTLTFTASDFTSHYSDANSDSLKSVKIISLPANGTLNSNGVPVVVNQVIASADLASLTFLASANFNGSTSFDWNANDGTFDAESDATVNLTVTTVNDAPVAVDDSLSTVAEDSSQRTIPFATLLSNDSPGPADESGQTLNIIGVGTAVGGTVSISGNNVLFTLTADFNGTASFVYTNQDNGQTAGVDDFKTSTATVSFTVTEVNDAPIATNDVLTSIAEDSGVRTITFASLLANDSKGPANESSQTLTITAVNNAVGGNIQISGTDVLFTPTTNYNGSASFDYTIQDNGTTAGSSDPKTAIGTVSFTITEVNDVPTATDDSLPTISQDSGPNTNSFSTLLANDSPGPANESSQTLTIIGVGSAVGGTVSISGTNVIFTPTTSYSGPGSYVYTNQDNGTTAGVNDFKTASATVSFNIGQVNAAPIGTNDTLTDVAEDSGQRTIPFSTLLANDSTGPANESGQTLTIIGVGSAVGGTVSISDTNVLFTPTADFNGVASFVYTNQDNGQTSGTNDFKTGTATASFTVTEVNDAPTATDDALSSIAEDSGQRTIPFSALLVNDSPGPANESGQTLTIIGVGSAVGGTVSISGNNVLFTPTTDYNGPASFVYTNQDNGTTAGVNDFKTSTATASFTITEVNDAPVAVNDSLSNIAEDSGVRTIPFSTLLANDFTGPANESGQTLTIIGVGSAIGGTVSISGTDVLFTPTADYNGPASFVYTNQDNGATAGAADFKTSTATASFTVTEVNDAPIGTNDTLTDVAEDSGQRTIPFSTLLANDSTGPANESGQTLTIIGVSSAVGGTVSISGTDVLFTPTADYNGPASFVYTNQDNGTTAGENDFKTSTATASFTITEVNDAPIATNDVLSSIAEDSGVRTIPFSTLLANDSTGPANESGQTLTIIGVSSAVGGTVSISGNNVLFTPTADYNGSASFVYTNQDNGTTAGENDFKTSTATVSFTITEVNDAPIGTNDTLTDVAEDSGQRTIPFSTLLANDSTGPANESGQTLTIIGVGSAVGGTVSISDTNVLFTPTADFNGVASFVYTNQDNGQTSGTNDFKTGTATASFTVTEVNDAPTATDDALSSIAEDSGVRTISFASLTANDSPGPANESGQTLTIIGVGSAVGGTVSISGNNVLFTPTTDYNGPASFVYTNQDNGTTAGAADFKTSFGATVSFTITEVNDAPTATDDSLSNIAEDSGVRTIPFSTLLANDSTGPANESGQTLTIIGVGSAVGGTVSISGTDVLFTPTADYNGPASFVYTNQDNGTTGGANNLTTITSKSDTGGVADFKTSTATASFVITEVNDSPTATNDSLSSIDQDSGVRTIPFSTLLTNDSTGPANESSQTLTIIGVSSAVGGTVSISGNNVLFTPTSGYNGPASFVYTNQDNGTTAGENDFKTSTATVNFTINPIAPIVTGPANGYYQAGQNLDFITTYSQSVTVNTAGGTPTIPLTIGSTSRNAAYLSGSGSPTLIFRYTVQAGDNDNDGIVSISPIALNGGTIKNAADNNVVLTFDPPNTSGVLVDTTPPAISISDPSASITTDGPVSYTVTYTDINFTASTLSSSDITLNKTGSADGLVSVSGTGTTRTVTIYNITGSGTLGISIAAGTASDAAGNTAPAVGPSATFTVDRPPVLTGLDNVTWADISVKATALIIDTNVTVTDIDSPDFNGGNLTITYTSESGGVEDQLSIRNQGTGAGQIGFSNGVVSFGGISLGTVPTSGAGSGTNGASLIVTFTSTSATPATVTALIENITYKNATNTPSQSRTISVTINDGVGGISTPATSVITILPALLSVVDHTSLRYLATGLMQQTITITNPSTINFDGLSLTVLFSASEKLANIKLYNAVGTNTSGDPYVFYTTNFPSYTTAQLILEYYVPYRTNIPNPTFILQAVTPPTFIAPPGTVQIILQKVTIAPDGAVLLGFATQTSAQYYIQYSSNAEGPWKVALPAVNGTGSTVQWVDEGPPKTDSTPASQPQRFYKVLKAGNSKE